MAQISHRINLSSSTFPFLSEFLGRTVILRGSDQNAPNTITTGVAPDPPQLYYAHNVLPTPFGYQSIGYLPFVPATVVTDFSQVFTLRDTDGNAALLGITETGRLFIFRFGFTEWFEIPAVPGIAGVQVTSAFVRGVTYVYFSTIGCYVFDFATNAFNLVNLGGVLESVTWGIVGMSGYLLAFGEGNAVAWSSVIDPTDFNPSLTTGAGGGTIEGAQGDTVAGLAVYGGIIFFCKANAVAAVYQANSRFPFSFVTIAGSGGLSDYKSAAATALDSPVAYAYTTSGLQAVSLRQAEFLLPEATEFLSGSRIEDFDEALLTFSIQTPATVLRKKAAWIADRYVVISYGITENELTHAIILDTMLGRVGKLKVAHVAAFEFTLYDQTVFETPKKSIGILHSDGSVSVVDTDIGAGNSSGVAVLGKYQYVRERLVQLQGAVLENIHDAGSFSVYDSYTLDGKTAVANVQGYLDIGVSTGLSKTYRFHNTGVNHSLICKGRFNLVSGVLNFNTHGKR